MGHPVDLLLRRSLRMSASIHFEEKRKAEMDIKRVCKFVQFFTQFSPIFVGKCGIDLSLIVMMSSLRVCEYEAGAAPARHGGALGQRVEERVLRGHEAPPSPRHVGGSHFGPFSLSVWR